MKTTLYYVKLLNNRTTKEYVFRNPAPGPPKLPIFTIFFILHIDRMGDNLNIIHKR